MESLNLFLRVQDYFAKLLYWLGWLSLALFTVLFNYEVFNRYLFNKPAYWAQDIISILVCSLVFFSLPYVTRHNKHLVIDVFIDLLPKKIKNIFSFFSGFLVVLVFALVGYFAGLEAYKQFIRGTLTASALAIPKWPIVAGISFSFLSSCLYQFTNLFTKAISDD